MGPCLSIILLTKLVTAQRLHEYVSAMGLSPLQIHPSHFNNDTTDSWLGVIVGVKCLSLLSISIRNYVICKSYDIRWNMPKMWINVSHKTMNKATTKTRQNNILCTSDRKMTSSLFYIYIHIYTYISIYNHTHIHAHAGIFVIHEQNWPFSY